MDLTGLSQVTCTPDGVCTSVPTPAGEENSLDLSAPASSDLPDQFPAGTRVGEGEMRQHVSQAACPATDSWADVGRTVGEGLQVVGDVTTGVGLVVAFINPPAGAVIATAGKATSIAGSGISAVSNLADGNYGALAQDGASIVGGYAARRALQASGATSRVARNSGSQRFRDPQTGRFITDQEGVRRGKVADVQEFAAEQVGSFGPGCGEE